jgi:hypothetical protein
VPVLEYLVARHDDPGMDLAKLLVARDRIAVEAGLQTFPAEIRNPSFAIVPAQDAPRLDFGQPGTDVVERRRIRVIGIYEYEIERGVTHDARCFRAGHDERSNQLLPARGGDVMQERAQDVILADDMLMLLHIGVAHPGVHAIDDPQLLLGFRDQHSSTPLS